MKKMDKDGLLLCELQAQTFELSVESTQVSSEIFIRRFMNSKIAKTIDCTAILETTMQPTDLLCEIEKQYGESQYGSVKFTKNEMYWIGYLYRYFAYTYEYSSVQVYKIIKGKELREQYLAYHTMDTAQAIERVLEAKGVMSDEDSEIKRQYEIFRKIRNAKNEN
ncbi:antitoxin [Aminicella lysinilytica]|jgi:hypothetical protein|uniref:Uncharacterized protein n=1 Tax=Aminicella lysinilytica TaxID=433323 RepID=A0A4R6PXQ4_9FIRM|nr:antitoxin [Aminicella lysinilytica]TDP47704.1 hypothetical protein EV211_1527 [Aminicella lysinilytica]